MQIPLKWIEPVYWIKFNHRLLLMVNSRLRDIGKDLLFQLRGNLCAVLLRSDVCRR